MTVTYTGNLKLGLPTTGTESGTWGDVVNNQITTLVDQSISGTVSLTSMTNADYTLTNGNGNAPNEARYMALLVPSSLTLTAARNIIVPSTSKMYVVKNATTGGFSVTVKTSAGTGIEVPNGNEMLLYCDGTNVIVAFDTINVNRVNGGQLAGLRNRIINGDMRVSQRGPVAAANNTWTYGGADRTAFGPTNFTTLSGTVQQYPTQVTSSSYGQGAVVTTTGTGVIQFQQRIEAANCLDMNGKTVTFVAYVLQDTGGALNAQLSLARPTTTLNDFTAQTLISSNTAVSVASSSTAYTKLTYTLTLGATDASKGLALTVSFPTVGAVTGKNFVIADMQFEIGSVATTFEQRPYGLELALCQRYYYRLLAGNTVPANSQVTNISGRSEIAFKVPMRTVPGSLEQSGSAGNYNMAFANVGITCTAVPTYLSAGTDYGTVTWNATSGHTAGQAGEFNIGTGYLGWSAEL